MSGTLNMASSSSHRYPASMEMPPAEGMTASRKLGNGRQSPTSPLKLFGQAKKKIVDIYLQIADYIEEGNQFLKSEKKLMCDCI